MRCKDRQHEKTTVEYRTNKNMTVHEIMDIGWNPVLHRFEFCERGLLEPKNPIKKVHNNSKKKEITTTEEI